MLSNSSRNIVVLATVILACLVPAQVARAQLGILTSTIGSGEINDSAANWVVGMALEEGDRIVTQPDSFGMVFFVSGLGGAEIEFDGTIVVEIDHSSEILIRRGRGRRAPIDVHVVKGRVRAFFDAGEHKDFILLSTPLGRMKVTGSIIYATHDLPEEPGDSTLGTFDSDCRVTLDSGEEMDVSQYQKVIVQAAAPARIAGMTVDDINRWETFPDMNMASALTHRGDVRTAYAGRSWVGEYVTSAERLEDVASEGTANIPDQEPEVASSTPNVVNVITTTRPRQTQPAFRSSSGGRRVGDDEDGVGRQTLNRMRRSRQLRR